MIPVLRWLLGTLSAVVPATIACSQSPLEVTGLPETAPLAVSAMATEDALFVDVELGPEWHLYSRDVGGGEPVSIVVEEGFAAAGTLAMPADPRGWITGRSRLVLPIARQADAGAAPLRARMRFQVCDALECLEPMEVTLGGTVEPLRVLLVVAAEDPHSERIAGWLSARGMQATITTYADVDAPACDAADVVIADSQLFRNYGVSRELMHGFPRTETPIVAVGFIGTELVEAHGVAMTSGYI